MRSLITVILSLGLAICTFAGVNPTQIQGSDIGSTIPQLEARYGKVQKTESAWCGKGTAYCFKPITGCCIIAIVKEGKNTVSDIVYAKQGGMTKEEGLTLFERNICGETRNTPFSRGRMQKNSRSIFRNYLTGQPYIESYQCPNTSTGIMNDTVRIGNEYTPTNRGADMVEFKNWSGFQVRLSHQFKIEQAALKKS